MPLGANSIELLRYFRQPETAFGKSVQRSWQFWCFFLYDPFSSESKAALAGVGNFGLRNFGSSLASSLNKDFPPIIQPFHVLDVTIPSYKFQREVMMYGQVPRSFPVLDFKGFEISITLEEDEQGTVAYFINWLQRRIIDNKGYYNAPNKVKIPGLVIEIQDKMGIPVVYYIFHDIFLTNVDDVQYSYTDSGTIKRNITFACDRLTEVFVKQNAVAAIIGAGAAAGSLTRNTTSQTAGLTQFLGRRV